MTSYIPDPTPPTIDRGSTALVTRGPGFDSGNRITEISSPDFSAGPQDIHGHQDDILDRLAGHYTPFEGYDFLVRAFEKTVRGNLRASFRDGNRLAEVIDGTITPKVGITFLAGADNPQVNQMEQISMSRLEPDQKDASWRVNTAGALLKNFEFDQSMSIICSDNTSAVVASARQRASVSGPFVESTSPSNQRALAIRNPMNQVVTIDSESVIIVNSLSGENWDLEGVLIEVDQSSLMAVIVNYRKIIQRGGANLPGGETVAVDEKKIKLLDQMIEDARRLCIRSPTLFRMATRRHIISSKNTRYGVDNGNMFQTLTTSSGIKNIISLSAAYFNSLASYNTAAQQLIRPRFLQMLVLLLSLLNDDDLHELAEFLEVTYRIRAERQHLELLVLKVLPLISINSKIFLNGLITAFEGPLVNPSPHLVDQPEIWRLFLLRLLRHDYMLPGTIEQLTDQNFSWVSKWPEDGYRDSRVFRHLQYSGRARAFNEIPPIDFHTEHNSTEVTAVFTNGCRYIVSVGDLENIIRMVPGRYALTEAVPEGRHFDLDITEVQVNEPLYRAIWEVNSILTTVKGILPARRRSGIVDRLAAILGSGGNKNSEGASLPEVKGSGRLTYHAATLNGQMLAVAYKVEGRKITRRELVRHIASDLGKMMATMDAIETAVQQASEEKKKDDRIRQTVHSLRTALGSVGQLYRSAEENKQKMENFSTKLGDEPISKVLYPIGSDETPLGIWNNYRAWYVGGDNVLYIESHRRAVRSVAWHDESVMEVTFHQQDAKYYLTPLRKLQEDERDEELKPNDQVILAGQYIIVVESNGQMFVPNSEADGRHNTNNSRSAGGGTSPEGGNGRQQIPLEKMLNWLKITGVETPRRKRRNPQQEMSQIVRSAIR
ncbi:hypothetical protein LTR84_005088 [Exophiala bonariae]|uniref:Uncharacterized protein n=1 Tax=Exophiala bonariae TaxID=1690606 RepID=A0AAV9NSQ3_9EURO|nr:hypothetical protein LTR84_005088 [Exophiala bonariae]